MQMEKASRPAQRLGSWLDREGVAGYVFIAPFIIGLVAFTVIPFFTSLYLAFTQYNVLTPAKWIGLDNFKKMFFEDKLFWKSFWITFKFAIIQVPLKLTISLLVALALSRQIKTAAYHILMLAFSCGMVYPLLWMALLWKQLWAYKGVINSLLKAVGLPGNIKWLSDPNTALGVLIGLGLWQFGSSMLIFLAAIKNIPASYHEAAIVDGAGPVKCFFKITLPMLTPIFLFNLINQTIGAFQAFNSSYLITQGGPLNSTLYYGVHLYNRAFTYYEMGYGSAMAWFMLLVIALLTLLIFKSSSAWVYYESEGK